MKFILGLGEVPLRSREAVFTTLSHAPALSRKGSDLACLAVADPAPEAGGSPVTRGYGIASRTADERAETTGSLYRKYAQTLFWVCKRYTRNDEDAEDMVHQVFLKVQKNLSGFRNQSGIYTWLYRIAVNECIQMFRKRKYEVDAASLPALEEAIPVFPEKAMDARLVLEKILAGSDPQTVEILFLLYLEGMKQEEAAEMLKISRTTLNRKITAFKSKMERFQW